jgi:3-hydroxyisobutyrate dehydrogenase-like beta-hydroxyacid dehydrogenase
MEKIAFLGLGIMGQNVTVNLLKAGYSVTVYNRTAAQAARVVKAGATLAPTAREAVAGADVVMIMVSDDAAVEAMVFGENGALAGVTSGQIVMDLTTVLPKTSLREAAAFNAKGAEFLDAPVFGSKGESRDAALWIVVGGKREAFDQVLPIFKVISATQHYMGDNGKGTSMKLVGNLVVAAELEALGESMALAVKAGLDPKDVLGVFAVADFKAPLLSGVGDALCRRDFSPSFYLKLMLKDANLIAAFAQELNVPIPAAAATREIIKTAVNKGWGDLNASAMIRVIEENAGVEVKYR